MAELNYNVVFEEYTKKHYVKKFEKKYEDRWERTLKAAGNRCILFVDEVLWG